MIINIVYTNIEKTVKMDPSSTEETKREETSHVETSNEETETWGGDDDPIDSKLTLKSRKVFTLSFLKIRKISLTPLMEPWYLIICNTVQDVARSGIGTFGTCSI